MNIAEFDQKITVEKAVVSTDEYGGQKFDYENIPASSTYTCWAKVEYKKGFTDEQENMLTTKQKVDFTIRNTNETAQNITANNTRVTYPVKDGGDVKQAYNIYGVTLQGRKNLKVLHCELETDINLQRV